MEEQKTPTLEELQALIEMTNTLNMEIFYWWCIALMICIHAGFLSYEIGASRLKNALAAGVKNILAFGFIVPSVFLLGWAVYNAFPDGLVPRMDAFLAGMPWSDVMGPNVQDNATGIFWAAFAMFAATTGSIMSGAIIERARMSAFIILTIVLGGFLWLLAAAWGWHPEGWLTVKWGYHDVGAAGVVHMIAGFFALAVVMNLGARIGRFNEDGSANAIVGHSMPMSVVGLMLIIVGFFGFLGGCIIYNSGAQWINIYGQPTNLGLRLQHPDGLRRRSDRCLPDHPRAVLDDVRRPGGHHLRGPRPGSLPPRPGLPDRHGCGGHCAAGQQPAAQVQAG